MLCSDGLAHERLSEHEYVAGFPFFVIAPSLYRVLKQADY